MSSWMRLLALGVWLTACGAAEVPAADVRAVRAIEIHSRSPVSAARYAGALDARERVDVAFQVGGRIASVAAVGGRPLQEGDVVRRGQVLATLDDADLRRMVTAAEAELGTAEAQADGARAAHAQATVEADRARRLAAAGDLPKAELERVETALISAAAAVRSAEAQVDARTEKRALARSAVADARLTSPIDGVVARRVLDVGESVAPGMAAFTVIDTSQVLVVFAIPDTRVDALAMGTRLPVRVEAVPERTFVGTVVMIAPVADPALRSFTIEVEVDNADGALRAGMVASVGVEGEPAPPTAIVPLGAVVRDPGAAGGFAVYVIEADATARLRPIVVADLVGNEAIVEDGLTDGERVVVDGAQLLHDGAAIVVRP